MTKINQSQISEIMQKYYNDSGDGQFQSYDKFHIGELLLEICNSQSDDTDDLYGDALSLSKSRTATENKRYLLGARQGATRIIGEAQVLEGYINSNIVHVNVNGQIFAFPSGISLASPYAETTDGYIGDSRQDKRGDCYLLAEINAIRNTKGGQKLLKQNCKKNMDGSYTVTLPGAKKIRQEYLKNGKKCEITGTYNISKSALNKAGNSTKYSDGDLEVVAYELAMEAFRAEMYITNKLNGNTQHSNFTAEGQVISFSHANEGDILSGGQTWDAGYILTGQKSDIYFGFNDKQHMDKLELYTDGKYGYITREEMAQRTNADISMYRTKGQISTVEISHLSNEERNINEMLDKYQGKEGQYAITFGVKVGKTGPDGMTKEGGGHALTVVKITDDTVYVSNPWHPEKIEPIPRNDFIKMCTSLQVMPVQQNTVSMPFNMQNISQLSSFLQHK